MSENSDLVWAIVRVFVALPIVLFLAFLLIKYGLSKRFAVSGDGRTRMRLLEQLPIGPKAVLNLVACGDKYYLLACQDNAIQLVKEMDQLPSVEKAVSGDVMELIPRSVSEMAQNKEKGSDQWLSPNGDKSVLSKSAHRGRALLASGLAMIRGEK